MRPASGGVIGARSPGRLGASDALGLAFGLCAGALLVMVSLNTPIPVADLPTLLALDREGVFDVDRATSAAGQPFVHGSWLAQALYARVFEVSGFGGLVALHGASLGLALAACARRARARAGGSGVAMAMAWALVLMAGNTGARPQTLAFALAAGLICTDSAVVAFALVALWANLHGSVVIAPLLALGQPRRTLAATLGLACTPWGAGLFEYVWLNSTRPAGRGLDEWSRPGLAGGYALRLSLAAACAAALGRRAPRAELAVVLALAALSLTALRHVAWLGLIGGALVAGWLPRHAGEPRARANAALGGALGLALLGLVRAAPWREPPGGWFGDQAPRFLVEGPNPGLRSLNAPFELAGLARLRWGVRTEVDVRLWVFDDATWARHLAHRRVPPAEPVLLCVDREPVLDDATRAWPSLAEEGCWRLRAPPGGP